MARRLTRVESDLRATVAAPLRALAGQAAEFGDAAAAATLGGKADALESGAAVTLADWELPPGTVPGPPSGRWVTLTRDDRLVPE